MIELMCGKATCANGAARRQATAYYHGRAATVQTAGRVHSLEVVSEVALLERRSAPKNERVAERFHLAMPARTQERT